MSPRDTERLLEAINKGTIASKPACDEMQRIMRAKSSGRAGLTVALLPSNE